jgi:ABC-type Fe3+ transport system permease subunit
VSGFEAGEVVAMLAIFLGGVTLGVLVLVSWAIRREDRRSTLTRRSNLSRRAPDAAARGARLLTGVGSRNISPPEH